MSEQQPQQEQPRGLEVDARVAEFKQVLNFHNMLPTQDELILFLIQKGIPAAELHQFLTVRENNTCVSLLRSRGFQVQAPQPVQKK